jgi:hypothetical protein
MLLQKAIEEYLKEHHCGWRTEENDFPTEIWLVRDVYRRWLVIDYDDKTITIMGGGSPLSTASEVPFEVIVYLDNSLLEQISNAIGVIEGRIEDSVP